MIYKICACKQYLLCGIKGCLSGWPIWLYLSIDLRVVIDWVSPSSFSWSWTKLNHPLVQTTSFRPQSMCDLVAVAVHEWCVCTFVFTPGAVVEQNLHCDVAGGSCHPSIVPHHCPVTLADCNKPSSDPLESGKLHGIVGQWHRTVHRTVNEWCKLPAIV